MRLSYAVLAVPFLALAAGSASAQTGDREANFRDWDSNRNGVLEKAEFRGHPGNFDAMDANHDRVLSRDEFVNRYRGGNESLPPVNPPVVDSRETAFRMLDRNNDGVMSRAEWKSQPQRLAFFRADQNNDGAVSLQEYLNQPAGNVAEAVFDTYDRNDDGVLERREWPADSEVSYNRADRDNDGRVTFTEYMSPLPVDQAVGRFDDIDRNRNGVITRGDWTGDRASFDRLDRDNDNVITAREFARVPAPDNQRAAFDELDRNNNGVITRGEWNADRGTFDRLDRDNDNVLTLREFTVAPAGDNQRARFDELDRNNNGVITRGEWNADRASFDRLDRNGDNVITAREFAVVPVVDNTRARFDELDRNRDRAISRREWPDDRQSFDALDENGDGVLTRYEYMATAVPSRWRRN
jgi:Ca2+-binding EF-hand superfamily protein